MLVGKRFYFGVVQSNDREEGHERPGPLIDCSGGDSRSNNVFEYFEKLLQDAHQYSNYIPQIASTQYNI